MAKTDRDLIEEIKERYKEAEDASSELRDNFKRDMRFRYGEQWDDADLRKRKERGRPCLVFNRINPTIRQITNDQRQNSAAPEVVPVDDVADPKTAEVIQGMVRYVLNGSNAKNAFSTAFEHSVTGGLGYFRVLTRYSDDSSFDQELEVKRIINPLAVKFDPHSTEVDGSDAEFAFVDEEISKDKYKRLYKDTELGALESWGSSDNPFILNDKTVRVAEHFYAEYTPKTLLLLSDGTAVYEDELDQEYNFVNGIYVVEGRTRKVDVRSIKWCKTNGVDILERTDWVGRWVPVVPVYGEEYYLDGKRLYRGMVADARDPQMAFNALSSAELEAISLAPKAPWLVTHKNIEGYKAIWDRSNENLPYLPFHPDPSGYVPARVQAEANIGAITQASMQMGDNLKATTGVFDASLGARSNETSGTAIRARSMQGQTANYHYQDHLDMSLAHCGRILVDAIPKVYDARRGVRILGNQEEVETITVNAQNPEGDGLIYDLSAGKYDIRIQSGPNFLTKRQEAAASMMEAVKTNPQLASSAGDLMVKAMDWPNAQEIAERIKRTIPPQILGEEGQAPLPPEVQAQMQQMEAQLQQLQAALEQAKNPLVAKQMEIESKERIAVLTAEKDLEIKKMEIQASAGDLQGALQSIVQEIGDLQSRLSFLDQSQMQQAQQPQFQPQYQDQNQAGGQMPLGSDELQAMQMQAEEQNQFPTGGLSPGQFVEE